MRLIDRRLENEEGGLQTGTGPLSAQFVHDIDASVASVRYVLDVEASNACGELVRSGDGLFEINKPLFRMPAECFWVELFEELGPGESRSRRRVGYLVQSSPDGLSGSIIPFAETHEGQRRRLPCTIVFDLGGPMPRQVGRYNLRHPYLTHLSELLEHCRLCPDLERMKGFRLRPGASATMLTELAECTWIALPLLFAFVALLNSPQVSETRPSDLGRLNRQRTRNGRAPLLDHVEVRLSLGATSGGGHAGDVTRSAPRLHVVRGHVVRRDGKTFWRQSHLRGDSHKAIVSKTVRVTAGRSVRQGAAHHVRAAFR